LLAICRAFERHAVRQLQAAGAVLVGALNMAEYAYGYTTENTHYGPARNPLDVVRSSGGSSGGTGAAIAGGLVPVALGSDARNSDRCISGEMFTAKSANAHSLSLLVPAFGALFLGFFGCVCGRWTLSFR